MQTVSRIARCTVWNTLRVKRKLSTGGEAHSKSKYSPPVRYSNVLLVFQIFGLVLGVHMLRNAFKLIAIGKQVGYLSMISVQPNPETEMAVQKEVERWRAQIQQEVREEDERENPNSLM